MREVPRPYFHEYSRETSPLARAEDRRYFPNLETAAGQFFPSLGRSFDAFANLISPQFLFDRDGWTEEQRAVGGLISDTARFFLGTEYNELARLSQDPRDFQHAYPYLSAAAHGFVESTPFGPRGWTGFVEYLEQEPAELPLELALMGAGRAATGARRLVRSARPFDADVFSDTDLLSGRLTPQEQLRRATLHIDVLGQRQWNPFELSSFGRRELLEQGAGTVVSPQEVLTASHILTGHQGTGAFDVQSIRARTYTGQQVDVPSVSGILPEADIAVLDLPPEINVAPLNIMTDIPDIQIGLGGEGIVGGGVRDIYSGSMIRGTTYQGVAGESGSGLVTESGGLSGIYLGMLGDQGLFADAPTVSSFLQQARPTFEVGQLDTTLHRQRLIERGLHYQAAGQGLALHGRYGVQDPFSLVRLDPTRHREFEEGPISGVFAYEGDLRDMLFEIKNPSLSWERRNSLLEYLRSETEPWHVPDVFRQGGYDVITAVPSSVDRLRTRGFNQAESYFEGEKIVEGFVSGEPSFYAPAGETIIRPSRQIGTFDYADLYDLRTGEDFTGMPMELQYELQNYSIRGLKSLEQLEGQLRLHGRGGKQNPFKRFEAWMDGNVDKFEAAEAERRFLEDSQRYPGRGKEAVLKDTRAFELGVGAGVSVVGSGGIYGLYKGWQRFFGNQESGVAPEVSEDSESMLEGMVPMELGPEPAVNLIPSVPTSELPILFQASGTAIDTNSATRAEIQGLRGATRFPTQAALSNDERSYRRRRHRQYTFGEGMGGEIEALPSRAARHLLGHGTEGFAEMLLAYPGESLKRQGLRVAKNYGTDFLKSQFTGEQMLGLEHYLGDTLSRGVWEMFSSPLGAIGGAVALAGGTAYIGESSLDANYADVIESEEMRKQRFYDRFRKKPISHTIELGGKISEESGGLERLIESIVKRVLVEGADDISDKLVTKIGRKFKLQTQRGQL